MRRILTYLLLCSSLLTQAQKKDRNAEKIAKSITADDMKKHLYIIASKEMEGRDTPSPGLEKAAKYIEDHFKSFGLLPGNNGSYRQYYPLYKDSMVSTTLMINSKKYELNKDFQPLSGNFSGEMLFSEVVFAGYGISDGKRDDYKDLRVAGKLVMILDGVPAGYSSSQTGFRSPSSINGKMNVARDKGVAALLVVNNNFPRSSFNGVSTWSRDSYKATQSPFTFTISPAVAASIIEKDSKDIFDSNKQDDLFTKTYAAAVDLDFIKSIVTTQVSNVIAMLEGTDKKDEYVFITAHYDHVGKRSDGTVYYGADDDGSGTTSVLEIAEAFAKAKAAGKGPRRSIVFMTVCGEEKGLWGSEYYTNHPIFPLDKTTVDLNTDMIGRADSSRHYGDSSNYIYVVGDDKLSSDLRTTSEAVNKKYSNLELDYKFNDPDDRNRIYFRSDHYNFADKGVPIIFYYDGMLGADYHRPTDTPDKINYTLMVKRSRFVFYTAWEMANRENMLKRDLKLEIPRGF